MPSEVQVFLRCSVLVFPIYSRLTKHIAALIVLAAADQIIRCRRGSSAQETTTWLMESLVVRTSTS